MTKFFYKNYLTVVRYLNDFISLFYPQVCLACGRNLYSSEEFICTDCLYTLPKTYFKDYKNNQVSQLFWGRASVENVFSHYFFKKGSKLQSVIHNMKYKGQKEAGYFLGKLTGLELKMTPFKEADIIVPVPLHYKKQKIRGYNQSEYIARGIAEKLGKPVNVNILKRAVATETQTRKARYERWQNVEGIFKCENKVNIKNKHILLVDDIVTTGSTLEACANEILKTEGTKVSIVTLAFASV